MQLSREEFWVLDVITQMNFQLHLFHLNRSDVNVLLNKRRHHGLSTNDLIDLLVAMQKKGDLVVYREQKGMFPEFDRNYFKRERAPGIRFVIDYAPVWENRVFYSQSEIAGDFAVAEAYRQRNPEFPQEEPFPDDLLHFCATIQGAGKWEQTAGADWSKYMETLCGWREDTDLAEDQSFCTYRIAAVLEQTLDAYFDWKTRWNNHLYSSEISSFRRYHTERFSPWRATYWKTFSEGFECDFTELAVQQCHYNLSKQEIAVERQFTTSRLQEHDALFTWCHDPFDDTSRAVGWS